MTTMISSAIALCVMWMSCPTFGGSIPEEIVTYKELEDMQANCLNLDTCTVARENDKLDKYNCQCENYCAELDTCCLDSPYRSKTAPSPSPNKRLTCAAVYREAKLQILMIESCQPGWTGDSAIAELCKADAEIENDPMLMIPVTSIQSGITYRNYFCFICNNDGNAEKPVFWNLKLVSFKNVTQESSFPALTYDRKSHSWTIEDASTGNPVPVNVNLEYGSEIEQTIRTCRSGVISQCASNWEDEAVKRKCSAYMAVIIIYSNGTTLQYRNPHCAICNNEDLTWRDCSVSIFSVADKKPFSFALLLDVNRSDGDIVGEKQICDSESIYDPFFKKCRVLKCALPGHTLKNGKCARV